MKYFVYIAFFFGALGAIFLSVPHFVYAEESAETIAENKEDDQSGGEGVNNEEQSDELTEEDKEKQKELEDDKEDLKERIDEARDKKVDSEARLAVQRNALMTQRYALEDVRADIAEKEEQIATNEKELARVRERLNISRESLAASVRILYREYVSMLSVDLIEEVSSGVAFMSGDVEKVRRSITDVLNELDQEERDLSAKKAELDQARVEKQKLEKDFSEKESALAQTAALTSSEVLSAKAELSELNRKLSVIQSQISALLGVGVTTDDIVEAADFASGQTGVRKEFLLGMLIVETDLGRFTGGCTYGTSRMNDRRKKAFKQITEELGYDHTEMRVSCPPSQYTGTGGAMGVAQFMSDTWLEYQSRIAANTGHNPPDPWDLTDGVMAMALKLANDGARTESGEWQAAARYLGSCSGNTRFYCENVLYWAENYESKL